MIDPTPLSLLRHAASQDAAADLDASQPLLREVAAGTRGAFLRVYRPAPTLAFGQRDTRLAGYQAARQAAARHGFEPVVRAAGGRAAAYHEGCLIVDQVQPDPEGMLGHQGRFAHFGELFVSALRGLGVDAAVGEIPGEYCPGEFSVHGTPASGGQRVKLVGTAQRVVSGAWLFSSVVVVNGAQSLRGVTEDVYRELGLNLDPATVGDAASLTAPGADALSPERVLDSILATWRDAGYDVGPQAAGFPAA